jgi:hypothetical protein
MKKDERSMAMHRRRWGSFGASYSNTRGAPTVAIDGQLVAPLAHVPWPSAMTLSQAMRAARMAASARLIAHGWHRGLSALGCAPRG